MIDYPDSSCGKVDLPIVKNKDYKSFEDEY